MNIYIQKKRWKLLLLLAAILIGSFTLLYTNQLTNQLQIEEQKKVELWAEATRVFALSEVELDPSMMNIITMAITNNTTIPVIVTDDQDSIIFHNNISTPKTNELAYLEKRLRKMKSSKEPIQIDLGENETQRLYYDDSILLTRLSWFPYIQLFIVSIFIIVAYLAFSGSRKAEQNQVWVGMAKETAHQLGTPTSSLLAWIDLLKMKTEDLSLADEMKKDVDRLKTITDRFSKIGAKPELLNYNVTGIVNDTVNYLKTRTSSHVQYQINQEQSNNLIAQINPVLFEWVIENICKNAVDAMEGRGKITIDVKQQKKHIAIDITDTGKGIPRSQFKTVFEPGYTTKKRGWGLGLTLVKRIIEQYHKGKIFVADSQPDAGTTFRILLNS